MGVNGPNIGTLQPHVYSVQNHCKWVDEVDTRMTGKMNIDIHYWGKWRLLAHIIYEVCFLQALINSTVTANMNFTKTSPKFGQWSDHRANTVFGLGFSSEKDLQQVSVVVR